MPRLQIDIDLALYKPEPHPILKPTRIVGVALGALLALGGVLFLSGAFAVVGANLIGSTLLTSGIIFMLPFLFIRCKRENVLPTRSSSFTSEYVKRESSSSALSIENEDVSSKKEIRKLVDL